MPGGQRGPVRPQFLFHAPVLQYLNLLPLAGQADGSGGSSGNLTSQDAITDISAGFGNQTIWALDSGVLLDTGYVLDTTTFPAAAILESASLSGTGAGLGVSSWLLDSGVLLDDGIHYLDTSASPVLGLAVLVGEGDGVGGSFGMLSGPLAEGGPYYRPVRVHKPQPSPERIPVHIKAEPTVVEVEIPRQPGVGVAAGNRAVIAALYAAGAIDDEEFTALIAA